MNITHWNGRHGKGAKRSRKEQKRTEAKTRQEAFEELVTRAQKEHGFSSREAAKDFLYQQAYTSDTTAEELLREVFTK